MSFTFPTPRARIARWLAAGALSVALVAWGGGPVDALKHVPGKTAPHVVTLPSGLQYEVLVRGSGRQPVQGDTAVVHYVGTLVDGGQFDSSRARKRPFSFKLGARRVIKGFEEGVARMRVGGKRRLIIPPSLGYGARKAGRIPPNSTIIFEVELLDVR